MIIIKKGDLNPLIKKGDLNPRPTLSYASTVKVRYKIVKEVSFFSTRVEK